uniref:Homeodomain-only protein n=1 Tax=Taeniopygia guttata TaxID=59729 RepID=A0A674HG04_TAEGU
MVRQLVLGIAGMWSLQETETGVAGGLVLPAELPGMPLGRELSPAAARAHSRSGVGGVPVPIDLPQEEIAMEKPVIPTEEQLEILEYHFCKVNKHPDPTTLCLIAAETGLSEEQTLKWFKQRLAEWRKSEGLPSESGSVRD